MRKTIRKVGNSKGIIFNSEECKNYDINIGDIVEFKLVKFKEKKNGTKDIQK